GPGYAAVRREGTERSMIEHADLCCADTQGFRVQAHCRAGHATGEGRPDRDRAIGAPMVSGRVRAGGGQASSSRSGVKISSMEHPKSAAIRKASGRDGSYLSFSRAITVCRETPRAVPSSAWDQRRSVRRALMSLRMTPPQRYRTAETTGPTSHESMRIEKAEIEIIAGSRKNWRKPTARISAVDSTKASSTASAILRRWNSSPLRYMSTFAQASRITAGTISRAGIQAGNPVPSASVARARPTPYRTMPVAKRTAKVRLARVRAEGAIGNSSGRDDCAMDTPQMERPVIIGVMEP